MTELFRPAPEDLWFREKMMADPETMSYNHAWGGTIPFPREKWEEWHRRWVEGDRYLYWYRYLYDPEQKRFVGEAAYHYDADRGIHICDVIVAAEYRHCGYGSAGIDLLCRAAGENGVSVLYDDIAADNPAYLLFLKKGFEIAFRNDDVVMVRKNL